MVERAGLPVQRRQVMERVEDHLRLLQRSPMSGDDLALRDDRDAVDEAFDRDQPERERPGDAVAIAVEGHGLVLVHRHGGMDHAGLEPIAGQGRRRGEILGEPVLDRERAGERLHDPVAFGQAPAMRRSLFNSSRSATRGTGVANRFWTALTVLSASGFSLPRAGMQNLGSKT